MKRGFILTLDAIIAVFVVVTILAYANTQLNKSKVTQWSQYQMKQTGDDIVLMMKNDGTLQTLDSETIESALTNVAPANYQMRMHITKYAIVEAVLVPTQTIDVGPDVEDSSLRTYGKQTFLIFTQDDVSSYNTVEYWIWLR